ncbi:MAG: SurA N-terminal domain-containing protein [Deltaproteobacteria bacterium]|jgi:peptidyl-prolyl cis-trans isomerase D|nr:SurA N-terminal domain-containing protein [Deltaproteobacteria bacterium]
MLKYIRKRSGGIISILIIGAIALVFIFWGIGGQDTGPSEDIRIDGQPVSQYTYADLLNNVTESIRSQKEGTPLTVDEELTARRQALAILVDRQNLLSLANTTGRQVSVEAINKAVKSNPIFQKDGRFDMATYEDVVSRYFNRSLSTFEANLSDDLLTGEMEDFIKSLNFAPTGTVLDGYHFTDDKLVLDYVYFPETAFKKEDQVPTEEQIKTYYRDNQDKWRSPAKVSLAYVEIDVSDFTDKVDVTEEDLEVTFLEEKASLAKPEEAEVSQILLRFPSLSPTVEEKEAIRIKAEQALERTKTEDFKALAAEISEDADSAAKNGSMGTIRRGQTLPQVEEAIFSLGVDSQGQVIGPVESFFGYHLIMVEKYSPAREPDLQEAKEDLTKIVTQRKARRLAINKIEDLINNLPTTGLTSKTFSDNAKSLGLESKETDLFSDPSDAPPFLAEDKDLVTAALNLPVGQLGEPVDNPEHIVLYTPINKIDSALRPLEDETVRPEVVAAWQDSMAQKLTQETALNFINSSATSDWETMIDGLPEGVENGTTSAFPRMQFFTAGAYLTDSEPMSLLGQFFKLGQKGDLTDSPIRVDSDKNKGYLVLAVNNLEPVDESLLPEGEIIKMQASAKAVMANSGYSYWLAKQRQEAKVQLPQYLQTMIEGRDLQPN